MVLRGGALRTAACLVLSAVLVSGCGVAHAEPQPSTESISNFSHIAVVVMENHGLGGVIGNPDAPFLNGLAQQYAYSDNYHAVAHPSLPNYLALVGGETFGVTSDCASCFQDAPNLSDTLASASVSVKAYMEGLLAPCFTGASSGRYAMKHDPFMYFDDVRNSPARCQEVVPFSQLAADESSGQLPQFIWITPDLCHDMHDCSVANGDYWLRQNLTRLLESPAFAQGNSLLAIVWDENDGAQGNKVPLILAGPRVRPGYVSHTYATHYTLLRTIESAWGLAPLTDKDAAAEPLADMFSSWPGSSR